SLARSFCGLISCRLSIALSPNGVAAESSPRKLAAKFNVIYEIDSWPFGTLGKTFTKTGLSSLASFSAAPESINNYISPQKNTRYAMSASIKSVSVDLHVGKSQKDV